VAGATAAINVATRKVSSYSDPVLREAIAKRETATIAEAMNIPIGDPMEDTIGRLVRSPSPLPDLQEIRETEELRPLWNLLMDPEATGEDILAGFEQFRENKVFDLVEDRKNISAGVSNKLGTALEFIKENFDGEVPTTMARLIELNAQLPETLTVKCLLRWLA
jgi:hypothetical protein